MPKNYIQNIVSILPSFLLRIKYFRRQRHVYQRFVTFSCLFAIIFLLSGCSSPPQPTPYQEIPRQERQTNLEKITSWRLNGSVSVRYRNNAHIASINWQQRHRSYWISLYGPLGFGEVSIEGMPGNVSLTRSGKPPISSSNIVTLMKSQLGWYIPVNGLYYWVRGMPQPSVEQNHTQYDQFGHLRLLSQQNWLIRYSNYQHVNGIDLPAEILFQTPELTIKLVIRSWQLPNI